VEGMGGREARCTKRGREREREGEWERAIARTREGEGAGSACSRAALCHTPRKTEKARRLVLVYDSQNEDAQETPVPVCPAWLEGRGKESGFPKLSGNSGGSAGGMTPAGAPMKDTLARFSSSWCRRPGARMKISSSARNYHIRVRDGAAAVSSGAPRLRILGSSRTVRGGEARICLRKRSVWPRSVHPGWGWRERHDVSRRRATKREELFKIALKSRPCGIERSPITEEPAGRITRR